MELFFLRNAEWQRLYNCTDLDIDQFPMERRRQFVPEAWLAIGLCAIYYALYVPCLMSIWRHCRYSPCYRLLFYIGIMDLSILWILGFLHGWLSLKGAVFCSHPLLIYFAGLGATAFWMAVSSANLVCLLWIIKSSNSRRFLSLTVVSRSAHLHLPNASLPVTVSSSGLA